MAKIQEMATVLEQTILAESVYSMWLATNVAKEAAAGQFVSLYCGEGTASYRDRSAFVRSIPTETPFVWSTGWQEKEQKNFPNCRQTNRSGFWDLWEMAFHSKVSIQS